MALNSGSEISAGSIKARLLSCPTCGWVHYAMAPEEKLAHDALIERYRLNHREREIYESSFRQCLRCESPAEDFRDAEDRELSRAAGHLVTPVLLDEA